jgi:hypothetical protein
MNLHEEKEDKGKVLDTLKIMKRGMDDLGVFLEELANQAESLDAAQKGALAILSLSSHSHLLLSRKHSTHTNDYSFLIQKSVRCLIIGTLCSV